MTKNKGFKRVLLAGVYSFAGIRAALRHEAAFRQECVLAIMFIPLACFIDVDPVERVVLVATTLLVLIVELLNSAVEAVVDRIGPEHHELAGRAKDMASAAVLISLLVWLWAWVALALLPFVTSH